MTSQQIILITGATTGIGRDAALRFAKKGHRVIATGRNMQALEKLREDAKGALEIVRLDVTSAESVASAAREVDRLTEGHGVDVLVNNAGYGMGAPLEETSDEDLRAQFETNVFGLMRVTRAFVTKMRERGSGRIINVGSVAGRVTSPFMAAYSSTKYAVESITDGLRRELGPFGVQVAVVEPGPINTEFANTTMRTVADHEDPNSPYALVYREAKRMREKTDAQAAGPEVVTDAIEHAATARRAKVRYVVPFKMNFVLWMIALLPTRLVDWAIWKALGMTRKRLMAAATTPPSPPSGEPQTA